MGTFAFRVILPVACPPFPWAYLSHLWPDRHSGCCNHCCCLPYSTFTFIISCFACFKVGCSVWIMSWLGLLASLLYLAISSKPNMTDRKIKELNTTLFLDEIKKRVAVPENQVMEFLELWEFKSFKRNEFISRAG